MARPVTSCGAGRRPAAIYARQFTKIHRTFTDRLHEGARRLRTKISPRSTHLPMFARAPRVPNRLQRGFRSALVRAVAAVAIIMATRGGFAGAQTADAGRHVLLISVDGLHASDLEQWVAANPRSELAALAAEGLTFANATTPGPSDSFPGLLALVTGGTPKSTGVYYDNVYARDVWSPGSS